MKPRQMKIIDFFADYTIGAESSSHSDAIKNKPDQVESQDFSSEEGLVKQIFREAELLSDFDVQKDVQHHTQQEKVRHQAIDLKILESIAPDCNIHQQAQVLQSTNRNRIQTSRLSIDKKSQ